MKSTLKKSSGRNDDREVLNNIFLQLRSGDTLVVEQDLRSLTYVYKKILYMADNKINFVSIKEGIDITNPIGRAMIAIISAFHQMQVEVQNEKIKEGLRKLQRRNKTLGRLKLKKKQLNICLPLVDSGYSLYKVSKITKISRRTISRYLKERNKEV